MCAVQGWGGVCTRRGEIQPAQGEFRGGIKTANTPPWPAGVQRFDSMKRTPRVVIPPPYIEAPKKCKTGVFITSPNRAPAETQRSGFGGKRRSSGESEFRPGGRNEGCGACDNATVQEQGVSKILTINLNDMAKELKIK